MPSACSGVPLNLDGQLGPADVERCADLARMLARRTRGGFGQWAAALKLAGTVTRPCGAEPPERVQLAVTVLLTALVGGIPSSGSPGGPDDHVADAIDNLGFGSDDNVTAADLGFLNLARARELMSQAQQAELEQARDLVKAVIEYAETVAFVGSRTDRSLRWPAFSIVHRKVITSTGPVLPLSVPFAVAARRQFGADWDDHITGLTRRAEAVASLLRALPRRLHRLVPADGTPVKGSPRQRQALCAACAAWAEQHPDLAELVT
jgi:hypothetical protein